MPWKECHVEDERLRFVARGLDGEPMSALCIEFGISRTLTGCRFLQHGRTLRRSQRYDKNRQGNLSEREPFLHFLR